MIIIIYKITYAYFDTKSQEYEFAEQESKVLNSYVMANRIYHQNLFSNEVIKLNADTLSILPAYSSHLISKKFSQTNIFNIKVRAVSDRARNITNSANKEELKAIRFFNKNRDKQEYFSNENSDYYQYASVLRVDKTCLSCHGKKEDAAQIIQDTYNNAYDYKLGEIRGIISIEIPKKSLQKHYMSHFFNTIIYDLTLFIFLLFGVYYLLRESKKTNTLLEFKVKEKTQELKNSLLFDRLTLLPNRLKLMEDININLNAKSLHLSLINIDRFKDINDLYGFKIGDEVLKQISSKAQEVCSDNYSIYKLPNDEFALLTTLNISQKKFSLEVQDIISKIQESKFEVNDNIVFITLSCGIASNEDSLMTKANVALQIAKRNSRIIVTYDNSLDTTQRITQNIEGVSLLKNAIKEDKITPYFQPIYNTHTKKIEKYESLARIVLDDGSVILPFKFLNIAVKSKLYPAITRAMIRKSFEFFKDKDYEFSINISLNDIENKKTLQFIVDSVKKFPNPDKIVFELLESDKVENYEKLNKFIKKMKKYGCKIAIDDFGSGYSNFSHLFELHADYLKIDSSLVKHIMVDDNSRIIVKTIINFASNLGLKTIAEFVEDKDSLDLLESMGVDFIQGYHIGKPSNELNSDFSS